MDVPPYIPEIWKDLKLEFTDEYINKINKIKKINELNDISYKTPKIMKKPNKEIKKYDGCLEKNSHCIIL
tara:strand:+ start:674 stop:883 length:210 start_codon:yes stop_codon:yes gene_type:complete